jgi:hypothetical protein
LPEKGRSAPGILRVKLCADSANRYSSLSGHDSAGS